MRHLALAFILLTGCGTKRVIRDASVYQVELDQYHKWATSQAAYLRDFIEEHCACESDAEGPQFADLECEKAADFVLTIEARAEWHRQMSLWNAGLIPEGSEPADTPPAIEPLSCPLPAAPSDEE